MYYVFSRHRKKSETPTKIKTSSLSPYSYTSFVPLPDKEEPLDIIKFNNNNYRRRSQQLKEDDDASYDVSDNGQDDGDDDDHVNLEESSKEKDRNEILENNHQRQLDELKRRSKRNFEYNNSTNSFSNVNEEVQQTFERDFHHSNKDKTKTNHIRTSIEGRRLNSASNNYINIGRTISSLNRSLEKPSSNRDKYHTGQHHKHHHKQHRRNKSELERNRNNSHHHHHHRRGRHHHHHHHKNDNHRSYPYYHKYQERRQIRNDKKKSFEDFSSSIESLSSAAGLERRLREKNIKQLSVEKNNSEKDIHSTPTKMRSIDLKEINFENFEPENKCQS
ncbi:hypothetical protein SNEBB_000776 [Seison nebaliae]|nr:hypothetical protein SNEBB_000776 [Seison nebaliae]